VWNRYNRRFAVVLLEGLKKRRYIADISSTYCDLEILLLLQTMAMSQMVKLEELMDPEKRGMKDFLLQMPREDVLALSKTSAPLIIVKNVEGTVTQLYQYYFLLLFIHIVVS